MVSFCNLFTAFFKQNSLFPTAVQIHFVPDRNHWVTSSYSVSHVKLYDSLFNDNLTPSLEAQLVQLYRPAIEGGVLLVTAESVQQQTGANDCRVFCIMFAFYAARALDVSHLQVNQQDMREHLSQCFELQELTPFPPTKRSVYMSQVKHFEIRVYCACMLPASYDTEMIMCDQCAEWYHCKCVSISSPPDSWLCTKCL